jgi:ribosomal protein S27AE
MKSRSETKLKQIDHRPQPLTGESALEWLVGFAKTDLQHLVNGPPGNLANLLYDLRRWLDLEPHEPLSGEVSRLEKQPLRLQEIVTEVAGLMKAIAGRRTFTARYKRGSVVLHADRLTTEGARALSYRDANLRDAVIRVALDDIYENPERALRIRRCREERCAQVFFANHSGQIYCGHRCANAAAARVYRERHRDERAAKERQRYRVRKETERKS